jgi:hypothetical protein
VSARPSSFSPKPELTPEQRRARVHRRHLRDGTGATSVILRHLNFPSGKHRDFVRTLQGLSDITGREFRRSHANIAEHWRKTNNEFADSQAVTWESNWLDNWQAQNGVLVFGVARGGGEQHRATRYVDHISPAAVWLQACAHEDMRRERQRLTSEAERKKLNLTTFMLARVDEAIKQLPCITPRPAEIGKSMVEDTAVRVRRNDSHLMKRFRANIELKVERQESAVEYTMDKAREMIKRAYLVERGELVRVQFQIEAATDESVDDYKVVQSSTDSVLTGEELATGDGIRGGVFDIPENSEAIEIHEDTETLAYTLAQKGCVIIPNHTPDERGYCDCQRGRSCATPGKHPRLKGWQKRTANDLDELRGWFARYPNTNIGAVTGEAVGIFVLDVDPDKNPKKCGAASLRHFVGLHGALPYTFITLTGGGGLQAFFKYPSGVKIENSASKIGPGLDVRGDGGQVLLPGSLHKSGKRYAALDLDAPIAEAPQWLIDEIMKPRQSPDSKKPNVPAINTRASVDGRIPEGQRDDWLFRKVACRARHFGASYDHILAELFEARDAYCEPGSHDITDADLRRMAKSAMKYEPSVNVKDSRQARAETE